LQGYGITLGTINGLNMVSSILQAIPSLPVQAVTLITWMIARFFMYSRWVGGWVGGGVEWAMCVSVSDICLLGGQG
jgi:poly(A) polymerase Pap1